MWNVIGVINMTDKKSFLDTIKEQFLSNLYSIILEALIMLIIASYAVYEIKQTREDFKEKMDASYTALSSFSKSQAEKIDHLTDQVEKLNLILSQALDVAVDDIQENKDEYYNAIKDKSKNALNSWLEKRRNKSVTQDPAIKPVQ